MRRRDTCILSEEGTQAAPFLLRVKSSWFFKGHKKKASKGKKIRVGFCVLPFSFKGFFKGPVREKAHRIRFALTGLLYAQLSCA